ncbi:hypothetical protein DDB_G0270684 [Dictyostelium discoideum AX4]|uniref:Uncharacterized protein n=1 Tax=Dictyostelium discoideum TaxID=44689 RepID=Q55CU0_DICDI|nr:hypothetical protein DDB_G0270684 [Dictyostelium discoideum AX4]EAL72692.1 hypothetical protein DDB_G0270684 [Dictyostelium discoideum AX4]|eukprot:XP_646391.1 hypothetical protein DDB_G0270684 [Dictyostelium discoideum AX4]
MIAPGVGYFFFRTPEHPALILISCIKTHYKKEYYILILKI